MQHEVTKIQELLDYKGHIQEEGWARRPVWKYDRRNIKASNLRKKEWDYYAVISHEHEFAIAATFSDLGFAALFALTFIDLRAGKTIQIDAIKALSLGKLSMPSHSGDHSIAWANTEIRLAFSRKNEQRRLLLGAPHMILPDGRMGLNADLTLIQQPNLESMNIATSWAENRKAFYLNEKINCMPVVGQIQLGQDEIHLDGTEAFGVLDWGRGRWTYTNRWFWGSASGLLDGIPFGFNIGYGFSDRSPATENVIIYNNTIHKLDQVTFHIPQSSYLDPWQFTSNDERFTMDFKPIVDRKSRTNFLVIKSVQHQVFGRFTGRAILDDGTVLEVVDFLGFAEDVFNRF
jgi:hypothetical protein